MEDSNKNYHSPLDRNSQRQRANSSASPRQTQLPLFNTNTSNIRPPQFLDTSRVQSALELYQQQRQLELQRDINIRRRLMLEQQQQILSELDQQQQLQQQIHQARLNTTTSASGATTSATLNSRMSVPDPHYNLAAAAHWRLNENIPNGIATSSSTPSFPSSTHAQTNEEKLEQYYRQRSNQDFQQHQRELLLRQQHQLTNLTGSNGVPHPKHPTINRKPFSGRDAEMWQQQQVAAASKVPYNHEVHRDSNNKLVTKIENTLQKEIQQEDEDDIVILETTIPSPSKELPNNRIAFDKLQQAKKPCLPDIRRMRADSTSSLNSTTTQQLLYALSNNNSQPRSSISNQTNSSISTIQKLQQLSSSTNNNDPSVTFLDRKKGNNNTKPPYNLKKKNAPNTNIRMNHLVPSPPTLNISNSTTVVSNLPIMNVEEILIPQNDITTDKIFNHNNDDVEVLVDTEELAEAIIQESIIVMEEEDCHSSIIMEQPSPSPSIEEEASSKTTSTRALLSEEEIASLQLHLLKRPKNIDEDDLRAQFHTNHAFQFSNEELIMDSDEEEQVQVVDNMNGCDTTNDDDVDGVVIILDKAYNVNELADIMTALKRSESPLDYSDNEDSMVIYDTPKEIVEQQQLTKKTEEIVVEMKDSTSENKTNEDNIEMKKSSTIMDKEENKELVVDNNNDGDDDSSITNLPKLPVEPCATIQDQNDTHEQLDTSSSKINTNGLASEEREGSCEEIDNSNTEKAPGVNHLQHPNTNTHNTNPLSVDGPVVISHHHDKPRLISQRKVPIDTWWPSNGTIKRERRIREHGIDKGDCDEDNDDEVEKEGGYNHSTPLPLHCSNNVKGSNLSNNTTLQDDNAAEGGVIEKLPHCIIHRIRHRPSNPEEPYEPLYCWQVTEIYPSDVMVCCSKCLTWRHAFCGGHYWYTGHSTTTTLANSSSFIPSCDLCHMESSQCNNTKKETIRQKEIHRQRIQLARRTLSTSHVMRHASFARHGGTYKWPLGSVSATHIGGHTRSVHARHERSEKQWCEMAVKLGNRVGFRPKERVKVRARELERLSVHVDDAGKL